MCDAAHQAARTSALQVWEGKRACTVLGPRLAGGPGTQLACCLPVPQAWRAVFRRVNLPLTICSCTLAGMQQLTGGQKPGLGWLDACCCLESSLAALRHRQDRLPC